MDNKLQSLLLNTREAIRSPPDKLVWVYCNRSQSGHHYWYFPEGHLRKTTGLRGWSGSIHLMMSQYGTVDTGLMGPHPEQIFV